MDFRVFFENGKFAELTSSQLNTHMNIQQAYQNIYEKRDSYAAQLKEKMNNSAIDISDKCLEEYQKFCSVLEPELDICMKYELSSVLPSLDVKIKKVEKL